MGIRKKRQLQSGVSGPPVRWTPGAAPYPHIPAEEPEPDLLAYWNLLWENRWVVACVTALVFAAVLVGTLLTPKTYRATGSLEIGNESPDIVPVEALFKIQNVSGDYLQTQFEILKSATLSERVIRELRLAETEEFSQPGMMKRWLPREAPEPEELSQGVLAKFQGRLLVGPVKGSRLVRVSFDSEDPQRAARVVNTLLADYIEMRMEASQQAKEWLSKQLELTKKSLEESERELQRYARANGLLFLENERGTPENLANDRIRQMQTELLRAQALRYEKEALHRLVQQGDFASLPGASESKLLQDLGIRLAELRREHAELSATFTPEYPKVQQVQSQIDQLERTLAEERERAAARITNEYHAAMQREHLLRRGLAEQQGAANALGERASRYAILRREVETNRQLYDVLQQKLKETGVSAAMRASNIGIVDRALVPRSPEKPKVALNLALGLIVGLGLGVAGVFLREYLDTSLRTTDEVDRYLDVPALAMIPSAESLADARLNESRLLHPSRLLPFRSSPAVEATHWYRLDADRQRHSHLAEAFGCLRTAVLLSSNGSVPKTLQISSSQPNEGKTTISVNLAISLAQLGQRVLLVDADLRRPSVHRAFEVVNHAGLADWLKGENDWTALRRPGPVAGLDLLTSGSPPAKPAEVLSTPRMKQLLQAAQAEYDFVIIDSPAFLINAADARILAGLVEGVVLVVRSGSTPREAVLRARALAPNLIGVVLNRFDIQRVPSYYRDYYGTQTEKDVSPELAGTPEEFSQERAEPVAPDFVREG